MSSSPLLVAVLLLLSLNTLAQQATPRVVPLPYDPLELATGPTAVPNTPEKRALLLNFLERVRQNNAMHAPGTTPFSMKVSFNSIAPNSVTHSHNGGYGEVEETWLSAAKWRWSARLGDYSQLRIFYNGAAYDDKPRGSMPLRLQMVRNAVFWPLVGDFAEPTLPDGVGKKLNTASIRSLGCYARFLKHPEFTPSMTTPAECNSMGAPWPARSPSSKAAPPCCRFTSTVSKRSIQIPANSTIEAECIRF
jgi:hypothetical protein